MVGAVDLMMHTGQLTDSSICAVGFSRRSRDFFEHVKHVSASKEGVAQIASWPETYAPSQNYEKSASCKREILTSSWHL